MCSVINYTISFIVLATATGFNTLYNPSGHNVTFCSKVWNNLLLFDDKDWNEILIEINHPDTLDRSFFDYGDGCTDFKQSFPSSDAAIHYARSFNFHFTDYVLITNSSSLKKGEWYSCSGQKGYCIFTLITGKEVIHRGVPIEVWRGFKNSLVKGPYYNCNIKGKYAFF